MSKNRIRWIEKKPSKGRELHDSDCTRFTLQAYPSRFRLSPRAITSISTALRSGEPPILHIQSPMSRFIFNLFFFFLLRMSLKFIFIFLNFFLDIGNDLLYFIYSLIKIGLLENLKGRGAEPAQK
jgi:hypothetical protein